MLARSLVLSFILACPLVAAEKDEWTVMVFMNGDNNLEPFALRDFFEMASVQLPEQINVVVQFDRADGYAHTDPDWTHTLRFHMRHGLTPTPSNAVQNLGEVNMGDGNSLASFVEWGRASYPAKRFMLIIWNHGDGWRFFETVALEGDEESRRDYINAKKERIAVQSEAKHFLVGKPDLAARRNEIPLNRAVKDLWRAVSNDDNSNDKLFNREIADSLKDLLQDKRLDILGFDACLMAMIETGYAMRGIAQILVASEELEPGDGWNYQDWLGRLASTPNATAEQLGIMLVDSYRQSYSNAYEEHTLSSVDLTKIDALGAALTNLSQLLDSNLSQEIASVVRARQECFTYAQGYNCHSVDLSRFCKLLSQYTADSNLGQAAKDVLAAAEQCIQANFARIGDKWGSLGIAIYFPLNRQAYLADPDRQGYLETNTYYPVAFVQDHKWDNFLHAYLAKVP